MIVFELFPPVRVLVHTSRNQQLAAAQLNELFRVVGKSWPSMN